MSFSMSMIIPYVTMFACIIEQLLYIFSRPRRIRFFFFYLWSLLEVFFLCTLLKIATGGKNVYIQDE
jgi:hypothetical protein